MKKIILICMVLSLLGLLVSGCGSSASKADDKKPINVVTYAKCNPLEYVDNGKIVGFDIDLLNAIADDAGFKIKISDSGWDGIFESLKNGNADMAISDITITDKRKESYDFSVPYFIARQGILVKKDSEITNGKDLTDKKVAVQAGSTGEAFVEKLLGKDNPNIKREKAEIIYQDVMVGSVAAGISDNNRVEKFLENNPDSGLHAVYDDSVFPPEHLGLMFPKDSALVEKVNTALNHLYENGKYAEIYQKWFKKEPNLDELKALQNN